MRSTAVQGWALGDGDGTASGAEQLRVAVLRAAAEEERHGGGGWVYVKWCLIWL